MTTKTQHRHPPGLWILAFGNLWDTFSYFGTSTLIVLYMMHMFHLSQADSYLMFGAYAAFAYALPILGGVIADRWLGAKATAVLGSSLCIAGNLLLINGLQSVFYLGIAISLIGSSLFKSTSSKLTGELYDNNSQAKEVGFTWVYIAVNVGGLLGPLVYGYMAYHYGWHYGFLCSAIGIALGLIWLLSHWSLIIEHQKKLRTKGRVLLSVIALLLAIVGIDATFYYIDASKIFILTLFILGLLYLLFCINKHKGKSRKHLLGLFLLAFFAIFYFAAGLQIGTSVISFLQHDMKIGKLYNHLPSSTFSTLYCFFVILLAPIANKIWQHFYGQQKPIGPAIKVCLGIFFGSLGLFCFAIASLSSHVYVWVLLAYLFLSAGELVIVPTIYTAISNIAPDDMKSTMMGGWLFFISIGGYLSSLLANIANHVAMKLPNFSNFYNREFMFIATCILLVALVMFALQPILRRLFVI